MVSTALNLESLDMREISWRPFDSDGKFKPAEGGGGLRRLAVRGASVTAIAQGLAFAIQMIATIVPSSAAHPCGFWREQQWLRRSVCYS